MGYWMFCQSASQTFLLTSSLLLLFSRTLPFELINNDWGKNFNIDAPAVMTRNEVHLARIEKLLGPFPAAFIEKCGSRDQFFDANALSIFCLIKYHKLTVRCTSRIRKKITPTGSLRQGLQQVDGLAGDDLGRTEDFLRRCLALDPNMRPLASVLACDEWLGGSTNVKT